MKKNADKHNLEAVVYEQSGKIDPAKMSPLALMLTDYMKADPDFRNRRKAWQAEREKRKAEQNKAETAA